MATETKVDKVNGTNRNISCILMSRQEAVNLIGLLAASLGDVALRGNHSGSLAEINIVSSGQVQYSICFGLKPEA
jgi:hypothetical protein